MSGGGADFEAKPALNPSALPVADAARILSAVGGPEQVRADIDAGAPTHAESTMNQMHGVAWGAGIMRCRERRHCGRRVITYEHVAF